VEGGHAADEKAHLLQLFRGWHDPIESLIDATGEPAILWKTPSSSPGVFRNNPILPRLCGRTKRNGFLARAWS